MHIFQRPGAVRVQTPLRLPRTGTARSATWFYKRQINGYRNAVFSARHRGYCGLKGLQTDVVYSEFSKAFDSVDYGRLVLKLKRHGVQGNLLSWLANYLTDGKQRTVVRGAVSKPLPVI